MVLHTCWPVAKLLWIRPWVYFLLTLNIGMADGILCCLNLNLSMHFRIGSKGPVTFKTRLYGTTVKTVSSRYLFFVRKNSILYVAEGLNWILYYNRKSSKSYQGTLLTIQCNLEKIWKTHPPRCPKNTFPEILRIKCFHLISNGLNGVNINLLTLIVAVL